MQNNDSRTQKTSVDHLIGSKASRAHTRNDTLISTTLSNSQNSQRKSSFYVRAPLTAKNTQSTNVDTDEGGSAKRVNSDINNKMERFSQQKRHHICNFYEGIYLIGNTKPNNAGILFKYGSCQFESLLPELIFPYGGRDIQKKMSDSMSDLNELLYKRHVAENNPDCFVLPIKSSHSFEKAQFNSNQLAYCICLLIHDVSKQKHSFLQCERVLCVVSYLPLIKYFLDFLIEVANCAKQEKLNNTSLMTFIQKCTLFETLPIQIPSQQIPQSYYDFQDAQIQKIKILTNSLSVATISINILLERSVVFLASNVQQLGCIIMLFLKHVKWIHQMVSSIPPSNIELLNVPVPLLGGIVIENSECIEQLVEEYPNVVFVDLFNSQVKNSQDYMKSFIYINLVRSLQSKPTHDIGSIVGKFQQSLLEENFKDELIMKEFRQTQYYNEMHATKQTQNVQTNNFQQFTVPKKMIQKF